MAILNKNEKFLFDIDGYKIFSTTNSNVKKDEVLIGSRSGSTYVVPIKVMRDLLERIDSDPELQELFGQENKTES